MTRAGAVRRSATVFVMLLTLAQAAERLGLGAATLRHQVHNGRLAATLYGKTWLVTEEEVERYRRESLGKPGRPWKRSSRPDEPR